MAFLTEEEKEATLRFANSQEAREDKDMAWLRKIQMPRDKPCSLDEYLEFLAEIDSLLGRPSRPFTPITVDHFLL